jgi:hypothetical protein
MLLAPQLPEGGPADDAVDLPRAALVASSST